MKKSVCLMALLAAFGTSAVQAKADSVIIDFAGQVADQTCQIELRGGGTKLDLGQIPTSAGVGTKGTRVPVIFRLVACKDKATKGVTITMDEDLMSVNPGQTNETTKTLSTDHEKVVVQFYTDANAGTEGMKATQTPVTSGNDLLVEIGHVAMKVVGASPDAKGVNAKAMFTVTYK